MSQPSPARLFVPGVLTSANIVFGFLAMMAASDGRFDLAVYLLLGAIILDILDGRVARILKATSKFGQELDSFSDALSFGAAPAFLVQRSLFPELGSLGVAVSVSYLLAAVLRLARFNLTSDIHRKARRTLGVPTPIGAGYLMALVLMRDSVPMVISASIVALIAVLMVSRLPLPEVAMGRAVAFTLFVGLGTYIAMVLHPNWYTVGVWNLWNVVILVTARLTAERTPSAVV
ncbi:MAG: CDP-diacylglycerol--serine O-phosphatidyltransferase [Acidobacteriota bacterium]